MKRQNYIAFTSIVGAMFLYFYLFIKIIISRKKPFYKLYTELLSTMFVPFFAYIMLPSGLILAMTNLLLLNYDVLQNILYGFLLLWVYAMGVIIVNNLLKWKRERLDQWNDLQNFSINRRLK